MGMRLATLIPLVLQASIVLNVIGLGLNASPQDATALFRRPSQLLRSLCAMHVVMLACAAALAINFALHRAVKIALIALAVSPIPPLLPKKTLKAGGEASYTIGLLVAVALLAIVFVPVAVELLGRAFGTPTHMSLGAVARLVLLTVLVPLGVGMAIRSLAAAFAARIARSVSLVATVLLIASAFPILFTAWPTIVSLTGDGTMIALAAFVLVGLAGGHLLGGPDPEDRTVLALSTASRHPGVALAIAHASFPEQQLVLAAVLLYLLVSAIVSLPYLAWSQRRHAGSAGTVETWN
jgi:BASS family bile acid:Na+ symporter